MFVGNWEIGLRIGNEIEDWGFGLREWENNRPNTDNFLLDIYQIA